MSNNRKILKNEKILKDVLKELMAEKNINQTQLSKETGIRSDTLAKYLYGETLPNGKNTIKLANFFNVSISYLFGETIAREADNIAISSKLGISDETINNLKKIKELNKDYDNKYTNILSDVLTNVDLYKTMMQKTEFLLNYHSSEKNREEINSAIKEESKDRSIIFEKYSIDFEEYIDLISCQIFLEKYHIYIENYLFENEITDYSEYHLRSEKKQLQNRLKRINMQLKSF